MMRLFAIPILCLASGLRSAVAESALPATQVSYTKQVAPIFREHCASCHNTKLPKGEYNLASFDATLRPGKNGLAFEPGKGKASRLVRMMTGEQEPAMPKDGDLLSPAEVELVRRWIDEGAKFDGVDPKATIEFAEAPTVALSPSIGSLPVLSLAFHPVSNELFIGIRHGIKVVEPMTGNLRRKFEAPHERVQQLSFTRNGRTLLTVGGSPGRSGEVVLWAMPEAKPRILAKSADIMTSARFSPNEQIIAAAGADRVLLILDAKTEKILDRVENHSDFIRHVAFDPGGKWVVTSSRDRTVKMYDYLAKDVFQVMNEPAGAFASVILKTGEQLYAVSETGSVGVWNIVDGGSARRLRTSIPSVVAVAATPQSNGVFIAGAGGEVQRLHASGRLEHTFVGLEDYIYALATSTDGKLLAAGDCTGHVAVWEIGGKRLMKIKVAP